MNTFPCFSRKFFNGERLLHSEEDADFKDIYKTNSSKETTPLLTIPNGAPVIN
jgi:hypothetical protein